MFFFFYNTNNNAYFSKKQRKQNYCDLMHCVLLHQLKISSKSCRQRYQNRTIFHNTNIFPQRGERFVISFPTSLVLLFMLYPSFFFISKNPCFRERFACLHRTSPVKYNPFAKCNSHFSTFPSELDNEHNDIPLLFTIRKVLCMLTYSRESQKGRKCSFSAPRYRERGVFLRILYHFFLSSSTRMIRTKSDQVIRYSSCYPCVQVNSLKKI